MADHFDLVILGSGSTAFAAALTAQELGKSAVMTESRTLGGTCVNRGCLPSKNLIEAAKLLFDAHQPRYPGLGRCDLHLDFTKLIAQKDALISDYRAKKYENLIGGGITVEQGAVRFVDPHTVRVGDRTLRADRFLVATGSHPVIPEIPGLEDVPYLTSDLLTSGEDVELATLPQSLLIGGGGYIALELGQMFARFGTLVTIVERNSQLLAHGYEPQLGPEVARLFAQEGIEVVTDAAISKVRPGADGVVATVSVAGEPAEREIPAERLLLATGRKPNTADLGLDAAGVTVGSAGEVQVDAYLRTSAAHIFAAGDVIGHQHGSQMATPIGARQGGIAARNALSDQPPRAFDGRVIPRAIFTDPPAGIVGMTEAQAIAAGHRCWCTTLPMELIPRAGAIHDTRGLIKMVADRDTNEVLGVTMLGTGAAEVVHEAAMGMHFHAKLEDFIELLHIYPTMAEALKIAALARHKDPAKLSCCAE